MNEIRKLDGVLNEEHRDIIADDVPVSFVRIQLDGDPRTSRARSAEPLFPATVENRTKAGTRSPARAKTSALVRSDRDS